MRHLIVATGIFVIAASSHAQSPAAGATADPAAPPLTKTVLINPTDSPLVRAAKLAVASRQHPSNRRVITVTAGASSGRGRVAQATGPVNGPNLPPLPAQAAAVGPTPEQKQAALRQQAQVKEKLQQLEQEQAAVGVEVDEPYGGDMEEDEVEHRLSQIEAQRQSALPPPPPQ
jgi:hypothetical protein